MCILFCCVGKEYGMKEAKIMSMDWRSLGYWPIWKDGKKVWVPKDAEAFNQDSKD